MKAESSMGRGVWREREIFLSMGHWRSSGVGDSWESREDLFSSMEIGFSLAASPPVWVYLGPSVCVLYKVWS